LKSRIKNPKKKSKAEPGLNVVAPHPNSKFNRPSHTFGLIFDKLNSLIELFIHL